MQSYFSYKRIDTSNSSQKIHLTYTVFRVLNRLWCTRHRDQRLEMSDVDSNSCTNTPTELKTRYKKKKEENVAASTKRIWRCGCVEGDVSARKTELSKI